MPPKDLQEKFVGIVNQYNKKLLATLLESMSSIDEGFNSLSQKAFPGQL